MRKIIQIGLDWRLSPNNYTTIILPLFHNFSGMWEKGQVINRHSLQFRTSSEQTNNCSLTGYVSSGH